MDSLLSGTLYSPNYASVDTRYLGASRTPEHIRKIVETTRLCRRRHAGHKCHTFLCSHFYLCANLITFSTRILFRPFIWAHRRYSFKRAHNTLEHSLKNEIVRRECEEAEGAMKNQRLPHISVSLGFSFLVLFAINPSVKFLFRSAE